MLPDEQTEKLLRDVGITPANWTIHLTVLVVDTEADIARLLRGKPETEAIPILIEPLKVRIKGAGLVSNRHGTQLTMLEVHKHKCRQWKNRLKKRFVLSEEYLT